MNGVNKKQPRRLPGAVGHIFAVPVTLLLTLSIVLGSFMLLVMNVLTNPEAHRQIACSPEIVDAQMNVISQKVGYLAEDNKLKKDEIMPSRASVERYNGQIVDWWTGLIRPNPDLKIPEYDPEYTEESGEEIPPEAEEELTDIVVRTVFPLRRQFMNIGLPLIMKFGDLYNYARYIPFFTATFWLLGVLAAGMIALLLSRRMFVSLQYIGGGLGAAGLLVACIPLQIAWIGLGPWLEQANAILYAQYMLLTRMITVWTVFLGIMLLVAGFICIGIYRKKMRAFEKEAAQGGQTA